MSEIKLTKFKIILLGVSVGSAYTVWGLLLSLMPPFYPSEAEKKGATPSQYGFVFGIASMAAFLFAPLFGRYGSKIGPKILYNFGSFLQAVAGLAFGFLAYIPDPNLFIGLSYFLRALGGIADVAAWGAVGGILMKLFPNLVARIMSYTNMCFGFGYMIGPGLGALLYEAGGFELPFIIVGSIGIVVAIALIFVIPDVQLDKKQSDGAKKLTYVEIAKNPLVYLPFLDNLCASSSNGMMMSMLEPHLASVGANTRQIGWVFMTRGAIFMISNPITGFVCDKIPYPSIVSIVGNVLMILSFVFIGPLPFIPLDPSYGLMIAMIATSGVGLANIMVSTFGRAQGAALRVGFNKDIDTYMMIAGLWTTSFYFGSFFGPTVAGFLVDAYGFRTATILFFVLQLVVLFIDVAELLFSIKNKITRKRAEYTEIE